MSSKGFEVFDHSEMPVVFYSSEILERAAFKESSALQSPGGCFVMG